MLTNTAIEDSVVDSTQCSIPEIPDPLEIAVALEDGLVTLRGTVESFGQRRAAADAARKVDGVFDVDNQLKVSLPTPTAARTTRSAAWRCRS